MNSDITILVNSCDKYEDAWRPFFECLWHFAGEIPNPIVLNTETKQFTSERYDVMTVHSPKVFTWSERLLNVMKQIHTEYTLFLLEDYFLQAPFDMTRLQKVLNYMDENPEVGFVDIKPRWANSKDEYEANKQLFSDASDQFLERKDEKFNITCAPSVWRTTVLKDLLRKHEDVWAFEKYVGIRARKHGVKVVRYQTHYPSIYEYEDQVWGTKGITFGKWLPGNLPFFEELGIHVEYDRLGILDAQSTAEVARIKKQSANYLFKQTLRKIREIRNLRKSLN